MVSLTSDLDIVVSIVEVGITSTISNTALRLGVDKGGTRGEVAKGVAKGGIVGLAAHGVDPELRGTRVKVDTHSLAGRTEDQVDGVESARLLRLEGDVVLALGEALVGGGALGDAEREAQHAALGDHAVVVGDVEHLAQDGGDGREGEEGRLHGEST